MGGFCVGKGLGLAWGTGWRWVWSCDWGRDRHGVEDKDGVGGGFVDRGEIGVASRFGVGVDIGYGDKGQSWS